MSRRIQPTATGIKMRHLCRRSRPIHFFSISYLELLCKAIPTACALRSLKKPCDRGASLLMFLRLINRALPRTVLSPHCALSSAVEHFLHTEGVAGSNPAARTIPARRLGGFLPIADSLLTYFRLFISARESNVSVPSDQFAEGPHEKANGLAEGLNSRKITSDSQVRKGG